MTATFQSVKLADVQHLMRRGSARAAGLRAALVAMPVDGDDVVCVGQDYEPQISLGTAAQVISRLNRETSGRRWRTQRSSDGNNAFIRCESAPAD